MKTNGGFLVTKIKQLGDRIFEKILSEKNIDAFNGAQGRILYVLWQEDGISIRSLSVKCGLAITSLTTMLERMEHQGLISRVQSETDKRKTLLFLTEKAHALKGEYDSVSDEMGSIYYKGFSEEEITRFEECLDRIRKNLEEWQKGAYKILANAKKCADANPGYSVFDSKGTLVYPENYRVHTVVHGDTLWKIAAQYLGDGSRYKEIVSLNGLSSNVIYSGQKLKIPN